MSGYNIYVSDYNRTKVLQFPTIPKELPAFSSESKNEEFETYWDIPYNFIDKKGLLQGSWDDWLPRDASKYYYCKSKVNGKEIIDLIEDAKTNAEPIRLLITTKDGNYVNDTFSVEKFEHPIMKNGDYKYSLDLKQWREYNATITTTSTTIGWQQDSTGWYYYYDTAGSYYSDSWQLIDNEWYSFDPQGYARQTTWLQDGGNYYWLKEDCKMARNEWVYYNYTWYYFGSDGAMYYGGTYNIDGTDYTFDDSGAWIEG
ncbi:cell wall binding repeat-containing protein [Clostridium sp. DL-VIII]|uniref:cell wall-binding protein n=1 Tax=Clostridium sp. DL-VIII TaxID=641107 RepID=UPI00023AF843|nr:cell wall-binding protein [Clostridium sp. DL-VIII]EHI98047.1 cell wall binding repeat-containing protein [Clostridium sp. DL-VIII]